MTPFLITKPDAPKLPQPTRLNVTITLPLEIYGLDYDLSNFEKFLGYHFSNWSDGRYPFDTELAKHALAMCLKHVVSQCVKEGEYDKYKGEYVESPGSKTAKGCVTAEALLKKLYICIDEGMKFAVSEGNDDHR